MIYLDHSATTPLDPEVEAAMGLFLTGEACGNPASAHGPGQLAAVAVRRSRQEVARLLGAQPEEIVFTSGGTEGDVMAVWGLYEAAGRQGRILYSATEHPAVREPAQRAAGGRAVEIPVDRHGRIQLHELERLLDDGEPVALVCVMHASNEVGTVQPVTEVGRLCRARGVPFHVDAVQSVAQVPFDVREVGCDTAVITAHKMYGPKGCGALYLREGTQLVPLMVGGGQEQGLRPGTLNVPGIVGLAAACTQAAEDARDEEMLVDRAEMREQLFDLLQRGWPDLVRLGHPTQRLAGHLSVSLPGLDGAKIVAGLDEHGIAISQGAACHAGADHVPESLRAMGHSSEVARGSLRITLGRSTAPIHMTETARHILAIASRLA
jgi:cysteine desulfurase